MRHAALTHGLELGDVVQIHLRNTESCGFKARVWSHPFSSPFHVFPRDVPMRDTRRVVETCKLKLRDALERTIKRKGGVHHAIIREAFLAWDMDSSGRLNPKELVSALLPSLPPELHR